MSECGAIVTAYVECLRYLVGKEDAKENKELLIKQQVNLICNFITASL
jgi:hypothetical protein